MTIERNDLSKGNAHRPAINAGAPSLVEAREIIDGFHVMIRRKAGADLDPWIIQARASLVASFADGVASDISAVRVAVISQWSNGQTEGQLTKFSWSNVRCMAAENSTSSRLG